MPHLSRSAMGVERVELCFDPLVAVVLEFT
jgi:hypothetical protein